MKILIILIVLALLLGGGAWWWWTERGHDSLVENTMPEEQGGLCYMKLEDSVDSEFKDKYTLRVDFDEEGAFGELRLLPAEKDALIGKFRGLVFLENKMTWNSVGEFIWNTEGEGMTAQQELRIIFEGKESNPAKIGFGEMILGENGVYMYKDPANIDYSFTIPSVLCEDLNERESVEKMLWENIETLSPIAPALGGTWYVVSAEIDIESNTGRVVYEDGHIQEKRNFSYATSTEGEVTSLTIE